MKTLRARLILGSLLWAIGLIPIAGIISIQIVLRGDRIHAIAHAAMILTLAFACIAGGLAQIRIGLRPFNQLRQRLEAVRHGDEAQVTGTYPEELQPLINELNALLADREKRVKQALAKAGDLAHGLKTPLAVLFQEADRAATAGQSDLAATLMQHLIRMQRQVDYHLAQARAAVSSATPGEACQVLESAQGLARTLLRLHAERGIAIDVNVPPDHYVRGRREGLEEMLGNLLDNACHWARSRVTIHSEASEASVVITIDDDGPGIAPELRDRVAQRGVRADEAAHGSGLGLAIVGDFAELYGGSIALGTSPSNGTRARLELPRAMIKP